MSLRYWISLRNHCPVLGFLRSLTDLSLSAPPYLSQSVAQPSLSNEYEFAATRMVKGVEGV